MPQVRYIGLKDMKADNVADSGAVWLGNGDVQSVSDEAWAKLAKHDSIWELVSGKAPAASGLAAVKAGPVDEDLSALTRDELYRLAKDRDLKPHHKLSAEKLLELLQG